jgi:hypothetical protein
LNINFVYCSSCLIASMIALIPNIWCSFPWAKI